MSGQGGQAVGPRSGETKGDETLRSILPGPSLARAYAHVGKSTNYFGTPKLIFLSVGFHRGKLPSLSKLSTTDTTAPVNPVPQFRQNTGKNSPKAGPPAKSCVTVMSRRHQERVPAARKQEITDKNENNGPHSTPSIRFPGIDDGGWPCRKR